MVSAAVILAVRSEGHGSSYGPSPGRIATGRVRPGSGAWLLRGAAASGTGVRRACAWRARLDVVLLAGELRVAGNGGLWRYQVADMVLASAEVATGALRRRLPRGGAAGGPGRRPRPPGGRSAPPDRTVRTGAPQRGAPDRVARPGPPVRRGTRGIRPRPDAGDRSAARPQGTAPRNTCRRAVGRRTASTPCTWRRSKFGGPAAGTSSPWVGCQREDAPRHARQGRRHRPVRTGGRPTRRGDRNLPDRRHCGCGRGDRPTGGRPSHRRPHVRQPRPGELARLGRLRRDRGHADECRGSWTQPAATCTGTKASQSAFWVGIDGYASSDPTVQQIGTDADCTKGTTKVPSVAVYYAWYELFPDSLVTARHRRPIRCPRVTP